MAETIRLEKGRLAGESNSGSETWASPPAEWNLIQPFPIQFAVLIELENQASYSMRRETEL
jgi:hypothetical protein